VAAIRHVAEEDEILVVTEQGMMIRMHAGEIRRIGRATLGVRVIRLDEGDRVVSVARAEAVEDAEDEGDEAGDLGDAGDDGGAAAAAAGDPSDHDAEPTAEADGD
jgi:DNA gyrase subunit A